jgi:hypothetical protein
MSLDKYISELLYRYDCVIVPNFGGFITNTKSAKILGNSFHPPYKQITFNSLLQNNDGLLANHIATIDKMPYETAVNFINFEVEEWIDKLINDELELENIGSFHLVDDKIQFEPKAQTNYLTSSFGLETYSSNAITRESLVSEKEKLVPIIPIGKGGNSVINAHEEEAVLATHEQSKKSSSYLRYAAIFVLGISIAGIGSKMYKDNLDKNQITQLKKEQKLLEDKIQSATFVIENPLPTITLSATSEPKKYHIIAGAFRNEKNATRKVNQLIELGYNSKIVGKNKWNLSQVSFESYSSFNDAMKNLTKIKNNTAKDAWLLVKNFQK